MKYNNIKADCPIRYYLLLFIIICILAIRFISIDKGFFSFYDEAYFLLKAREVADGIITGKSQWNFLAVHWFPFWDLSDAIYSRAAGNILAIFAAIIATVSSSVSFGKKHWLMYLSVSLLVYLSIGGQISYVNMQAFLLCIALSAFLVYAKSEKEIIKRAMLVIAGFAGGLSLFVICCNLSNCRQAQRVNNLVPDYLPSASGRRKLNQYETYREDWLEGAGRFQKDK